MVTYNCHYRQQREEITRKKEKMESMLKGKKNTTGVARPESPSSRRRRSLRRTTMPTRRLASTSRSTVDVRIHYRDHTGNLLCKQCYTCLYLCIIFYIFNYLNNYCISSFSIFKTIQILEHSISLFSIAAINFHI